MAVVSEMNTVNRSSRIQPPKSLDAFIALAIGALPFLCFLPVALGKLAFFYFDIIVQFHPFKAYFMDAFRGGTLPLWCPYIYCGFPLFAEGQAGALYPLQLLIYTLLPNVWAYGCATLLHVGMAGSFMFVFLRTQRTTRACSLLGAVCYMFSGFMMARIRHYNFLVGAAWLPALLLAAERAKGGRALFWTAAAAVVVAMLFLASHPYITMYVLLVFAAYTFYSHLYAGRLGAGIWLFLGAVAFGVAMAAVQVLPTYELLSASVLTYGARYQYMTVGSFSPQHLLTLLVPNFFGSPAWDTYWEAVVPAYYFEMCWYVGLLPLVLACVGTVRARDAFEAFFAALWLAALVLALGRYTDLYKLLIHVPLLKSSRVPARWGLVWTFAASVLAARGAQGLVCSPSGGRRLRPFVIWLAVAAAAALLLARAHHVGNETAIRELTQIAPKLADRMHRARSFAGASLVHFGVFGLLTAFVFAIGRRSRTGRRSVLMFAVLLTAVDLWTFVRPLNPLIDPKVYDSPPRTAALLSSEKRVGRVLTHRIDETWDLPGPGDAVFPFTPGWGFGVEPYLACTEPLTANSGMLWGIETVTGFGITSLRDYNELMGLGGKRKTRMAYAPTPAVAALLHVTHFVSSREMSKDPKLLVGEAGTFKVYRNPHALPRAILVPEWKRAASRPEAIREILSKRFDPRAYAVVRCELPRPQGPPPGSGDRIEIVRREPDGILLTCNAAGRRLAVLSEILYPGWRVWVDGRHRDAIATNHSLRGALVESGSHRIRWVFHPRSFKLGVALSFAACGLLIVFVIAMKGGRAVGMSKPLSAFPARRGFLPVIALCLAVLVAVGVVTNWQAWREAARRMSVASYVARMCDADAQVHYRAKRYRRAVALERVAADGLKDNPFEFHSPLLPTTTGIRNPACRTERPCRRPSRRRSGTWPCPAWRGTGRPRSPG